MNTNNVENATLVAATAANELIKNIKSEKEDVRAAAVYWAGAAGASAVKPLAATMADKNLEVARAAKRALWNIVRHVGRPNAPEQEKKAAAAELIKLLTSQAPPRARVEAMWMLSEIAGDEAVDAIAALLADTGYREDARLVLERIPGRRSLAALETALDDAPRSFKPNLAQSLRARGENVPGIPCRKLKPTRQTSVNPVGR